MIPIFEGGHIALAEIVCPCCGLVWPELRSNPIYASFFQKLEVLREATGFPIVIAKGGGCRCPKYQGRLIGQGKTDALVSPHFFMAIDWDVSFTEDVRTLVKAVNDRFKDLRMGYAKYLNRGQTVVHLDEAYLFEINPRPLGLEAWARKVRW